MNLNENSPTQPAAPAPPAAAEPLPTAEVVNGFYFMVSPPTPALRAHLYRERIRAMAAGLNGFDN